MKEPMGQSRRAFLASGAALAGLGVSGCCTVTPQPNVPASCDRMLLPWLAGPDVERTWADAKAPRNFDAHTHFFNARDVPVEKYLALSVAHSVPNPTYRALIKAIAPVAQVLANVVAPSCAQEHATLCNVPSKKRLSAESVAAIDANIDSHQADLAKLIFDEDRRQGGNVARIFNKALSDAQGRGLGLRSLGQVPTIFSPELVRLALQGVASDAAVQDTSLRSSESQALVADDVLLARLLGGLEFVGRMLGPRHFNVRTFIKKSFAFSPDVPLSGCFAATVDFNYWLDCPARVSHLEDQVLIHEILSLASGGFLLPLVAYNPWVDIKEEDASYNLVKRAVEQHGFVGAKIYPPMGFLPMNNAGTNVHSHFPRPSDLKLLDQKLEKFFALCESLAVPVMAHSNESKGRDSEEDKLAGPCGWEALALGKGMRQPPKSLNVNVGHFGGAKPGASGDWTEEFAKLMDKYTNVRLYGDVGFWDEILTDGSVAAKLRALVQRNPIVKSRLMYGTDWHMLSQVPGWPGYASAFRAVAMDLFKGDPRAMSAMMGGNVLDCYGIKKDATKGNYIRLRDHFAKNQQPQGPGWVQNLS